MYSYNILCFVPFLFISFAHHFHCAFLCFDTIKQNGHFSLDLYIGEAKSSVHLSKKYAALCWNYESNTNQTLRWLMWFHSLERACVRGRVRALTHTHTHTQCCSFIHWHFHSDLNLCFLPVNRNILLQQNVTVTKYNFISSELSFCGCNVTSTSVATASKMWVPAILLLLIGGK